jgi:hypothetical protein
MMMMMMMMGRKKEEWKLFGGADEQSEQGLSP